MIQIRIRTSSDFVEGGQDASGNLRELRTNSDLNLSFSTDPSECENTLFRFFKGVLAHSDSNLN